MTRRDLLKSLGFTAAVGALAGSSAHWARIAESANSLARLAAATAPAGSDLGAIDHIVFLMMENRSYDHYFGAYPRGRGFDDHPKNSFGVFAQPHDWGPQHLCWNDGKMNAFVSTHTSSTYEGADGTMTMGYYLREDLRSTGRWRTTSRCWTAITPRSWGRPTRIG
jgi:phospholipase C